MTLPMERFRPDAAHFFSSCVAIADRFGRRSPGLELLQFSVGDFKLSAATTQAYRKSWKDPNSWLVETTSTGKMDIDFSREFTIHW